MVVDMATDPDNMIHALIPLDIPNELFEEFVKRLTGNDYDIVLAAEQAINKRLDPDRTIAWFDRVELGVPFVPVFDGTRKTLTDLMEEVAG